MFHSYSISNLSVSRPAFKIASQSYRPRFEATSAHSVRFLVFSIIFILSGDAAVIYALREVEAAERIREG
jgi:hypothetical protein